MENANQTNQTVWCKRLSRTERGIEHAAAGHASLHSGTLSGPVGVGSEIANIGVPEGPAPRRVLADEKRRRSWIKTST